MSDDVMIRPAASVADYLACQDAQRLAWGITDDSYVVPLATLVGAQHHGGLVLGAFRDDGSAVGLSFAFLGKVGGRLCLYSQLTGIIPDYQRRGLGSRFKLAQREFCRREGINLIAWSFDPLQSKNAHFNIHRLGATSTRLIEDMYGRRTDALNAGTSTDRLIVEWPTTGELADQPAPEAAWGTPTPADWADYPRLITLRDRPDGAVEPTEVNPSCLRDPFPVLLQIPANVAAIRRDDPPRAEAWSRAVREAFQLAFEAGRVADGFLRDEQPTRRRYFYVLRSRADSQQAP